MTKFISSLRKSAQIAAVASIAGIMLTGSAMAQTATTCGEIGTSTTGIIGQINAVSNWHCTNTSPPPNPDPICDVRTTLAACCAGVSPSEAPSCICDIGQASIDTLAGKNIFIYCAP